MQTGLHVSYLRLKRVQPLIPFPDEKVARMKAPQILTANMNS